MLLGVLLITSPGDGALGITWAIGWLAMLSGGLQLWLASVVRHESHEQAGAAAIRTPRARARRSADMAQAVSAIHTSPSTPSAPADGVGRAADPRHRTILVPLDGSHLAEGAIPTAKALAARFGATVHTVTVAVSDFELRRMRIEAARSLGTGPDDPRIHVEVDTDVARRRAAPCLGARLLPGLPVDPR